MKPKSNISKTLLTTCFLFAACLVMAQENCFNGIDDDGDGLIDLNDTEDCVCEGTSGGEIESIIPNPSFEDFTCCPMTFSQLNCAEDWVQASQATSDYMNTCGFVAGCVPQPLPDGEAIVGALVITDFAFGGGDYFEYVGACLEAPMLQGESYTLQFDLAASSTDLSLNSVFPIEVGPIDITLYGFDDCGTLPLPNQDCPADEGWYEMGSVTYQPVHEWGVVTLNFTPPQDTEAIILGAPCTIDEDGYGQTADDRVMYFMFDDLVLNESSLFSGVVSQEGGNCLGDLILQAANSDDFTYQWYYEGVALNGESNAFLNLGPSNYDEGIYQVLVTNLEDGTCTIVETEVTPSTNSPLDFTADVTSGCAPLEVNFTNLTDPAFIGSSQWNFEVGSSNENDPTFTFNSGGLYDVTLIVQTPGNCITSITLEDYIEVFPTEIPEINYTVLDNCAPYNVAFFSDANESSTCTWNFGELGGSADCEPIQTYPEEGTYTVSLEVGGGAGCAEVGTTEIIVEANDPPEFSIIGPQSICEDGVDSVQAIFEDGLITWLDGVSGPIQEISGPGVYTAIFTRSDGCEARDSIRVSQALLPSLSANDKEACEGDPVQLFAQSNSDQVRWLDVADTYVAIVKEAGIYIAEAENECGVVSVDVEVILTDCSCQIYVPNSFTPNGDGINDLFRPSISCELQFYELLIFDRWGREVFVTNDPGLSWNGSANTSSEYFPQTQIFNYILRYDNALRPESGRQEVRGFVQMLR